METTAKTITIADVICVKCGFPASLDEDKICEFCRNAGRNNFAAEAYPFPWRTLLLGSTGFAIGVFLFWLITGAGK
jgi:hypothetical protein